MFLRRSEPPSDIPRGHRITKFMGIDDDFAVGWGSERTLHYKLITPFLAIAENLWRVNQHILGAEKGRAGNTQNHVFLPFAAKKAHFRTEAIATAGSSAVQTIGRAERIFLYLRRAEARRKDTHHQQPR